jgi:hypothetical protein
MPVARKVSSSTPRVIAQHRVTEARQPVRDTAADPANPNNAYRQRAELTGPLDPPVPRRTRRSRQ